MFSRRILAVAPLLGVATALLSRVEVVHSQAEQNIYDYIVVGGGVTGLVVANRLTEDRNKTVLVIEGGRADDNPNIRSPYAANYALNTSLLWPGYISNPEPELANKTYNTRVARVLGGGSIVNGMMYDRASVTDYNAWEALGNQGWGWEGLFPYFKKGTEYIPPPAALVKEYGVTWDPEAYGIGPLKIGISDYQYPDLKDFVKAFKGRGAPMPYDGNNGKATGVSWYPNTMNPKTGERSHARNSYYDPISTRSNLKIILETEATELVFGGSEKLIARGVKITNKRTGASTTVYATKEVVLAAGAVNTPKLLQLSGVGPKSVLRAAGIPVKLEHDGVGANFQDHPYTYILFNTSNMSTPNPISLTMDPVFNASAWEQYRANKTGPLTQARGNNLAFIALPEVDPKGYRSLARQVRHQKNYEYMPSIYKNSAKLLKGVTAQRKLLANLLKNDQAGVVEYSVPASGASVLVGLERPISRGTIMINPANPQGAPNIFYNAFSNPVDRSIFASCVRYIRGVWASSELAKFSPVETSPGAQYQTDEEIMTKLVELGSIVPTLSHPSCSCAMMPEDMGGCVSNKLLFYGISQLSIVDASIIPLIPSQHIQSTMYAIGEKAADIIKSRD